MDGRCRLAPEPLAPPPGPQAQEGGGPITRTTPIVLSDLADLQSSRDVEQIVYYGTAARRLIPDPKWNGPIQTRSGAGSASTV